MKTSILPHLLTGERNTLAMSFPIPSTFPRESRKSGRRIRLKRLILKELKTLNFFQPVGYLHFLHPHVSQHLILQRFLMYRKAAERGFISRLPHMTISHVDGSFSVFCALLFSEPLQTILQTEQQRTDLMLDPSVVTRHVSRQRGHLRGQRRTWTCLLLLHVG